MAPGRLPAVSAVRNWVRAVCRLFSAGLRLLEERWYRRIVRIQLLRSGEGCHSVFVALGLHGIFAGCYLGLEIGVAGGGGTLCVLQVRSGPHHRWIIGSETCGGVVGGGGASKVTSGQCRPELGQRRLQGVQRVCACWRSVGTVGSFGFNCCAAVKATTASM